jgi:hypothetical protein
MSSFHWYCYANIRQYLECRQKALNMNSRWDLAQHNNFYTKQKMTKRQLKLNYKETICVYVLNIISDDEKSQALHLYV